MLDAPFPWFGGKKSVAHEVWSRFGVVDNYVEPFFGSGAVLLQRPWNGSERLLETINDADHFVANFWRSVQHAPAEVAEWADWPINETDLAARHHWLVTEGRQRVASIEGDPMAYDAQVAGWWVWGLCSWIGSGWCSGRGAWRWRDGEWTKEGAGHGIDRKLPHLGDAGRGINRLGNPVDAWIAALSNRLRHVRVCAGDWSRVTGPSVTANNGGIDRRNGVTAVFLDPPYADTAGRAVNLYATDCLSVAHDVRRWAIANGDDRRMRICLAGYEGEHEMPTNWRIFRWKAAGGYGSQSDDVGRVNAKRERLWFSPHCLEPLQQSMLDILEVT